MKNITGLKELGVLFTFTFNRHILVDYLVSITNEVHTSAGKKVLDEINKVQAINTTPASQHCTIRFKEVAI